MKRVVIADAGPLIALARLNRLDLLPRLFGTVTVTQWVVNEVLAGGKFEDTAMLQTAFAQPWLRIHEPHDMADSMWQTQCQDLVNLHQIDMGEATALVLALQTVAQGDSALVLMDDFRGRSAAAHGGVAHMGTAGLLVLAKKVGDVDAVKPLLLALRQSSYFLSDGLIAAATALAQEDA
jgi:predicted nucleic acid-binding protein